MNPLFAPSIYAHLVSGSLLLIAILLLIRSYSKIRKIEPLHIGFILLLSAVIGIHGLSHLGLEYVYDMNPLYHYGKMVAQFES
jgi:hypothetical protein